MGVRECFLHDPLGRTMASGRRLKGERLEGGACREIPEATDGSIRSEVLGLDLRVKQRERELRFRHPETGEDLPSHEEEHAKRVEATRQAQPAGREARSEADARRRAERSAKAAERCAKAEAAASRELKRRIAELEAKLARRG